MTMRAPRSIVVTPNVCGADGVSELARQFAAGLPSPVRVVSLHDADGELFSGIPVTGAGGSRARFCGEVARLLPFCTRETIVVCVHLHLAPVARLFACRSAGAIAVLLGIEAWVPLRTSERWALGAGELVSISGVTARRFLEANPEFQDRTIQVIHPGLPDAPVEQPSLPGSRRTALIVARMAADERYKGHDQLIEGWPRVLDRFPDAVLQVVGDGADRERLEAKASALVPDGAIRFSGRVDAGTLQRLHGEASFFVMPSRNEGFGFVFLEAMRAARACIAGRGAAEEVVVDGETGLIVDPSDQEQVVRAVIHLFGNPDACAALGRAGRRRFEDHFTDIRFRERVASLLARAEAGARS